MEKEEKLELFTQKVKEIRNILPRQDALARQVSNVVRR